MSKQHSKYLGTRQDPKNRDIVSPAEFLHSGAYALRKEKAEAYAIKKQHGKVRILVKDGKPVEQQ